MCIFFSYDAVVDVVVVYVVVEVILGHAWQCKYVSRSNSPTCGVG